MTDYKKYINALRKCAKEHENDRTSFGHIIVSDLCRDTANLLELLEQDTVPFDFDLFEAGLMSMPKGMIDVLDKIRAEISEIPTISFDNDVYKADILEIIDKYRAESEENKQ